MGMRVQYFNRQLRQLDNYALKVADAHASVEQQSLLLAENQVADGLFRLVRLIDGENARSDPVNFKPAARNRHALERFILRPRKRAAPVGNCVLRGQPRRREGNADDPCDPHFFDDLTRVRHPFEEKWNHED